MLSFDILFERPLKTVLYCTVSIVFMYGIGLSHSLPFTSDLCDQALKSHELPQVVVGNVMERTKADT